MAAMPNLTPNEGIEEATLVDPREYRTHKDEPETPESSPEGQEEKETPKETTPEGEGATPDGGEEDTYKKRYADSTREAQRLARENEQLKAQMNELAQRPNLNIETPSDKELSESISDWDILSPAEQKLMKEQIFLKRKLSALEEKQSFTSQQLLWERDFSELLLRPEFASLKEKKMEFELYCSKNRFTPIEISASAFLFKEAKTIGAKEEKAKLERKGLEKGSGGVKTPLSNEITLEQEEYLRNNQPKEYERLLRKGLIK